ncbi:MAG: enoyl-CoA hydratase/isomerase family protein [Chloroflexi bacterium]|nr:MAG: enoyl-CoA hydratase/isomerase family protein [Chloroflexota bacterium]
MQQAYRVLRVVAESQTIRIVLMLRPNELMLKELHTACTDLKSENSRGIKAVVLDFKSITETQLPHNATVLPAIIKQACLAVRDVEAPVLAVVRGTASAEVIALIQAADLTLVAHDAVLPVRGMGDDNNDTLTGEQAHRLGYITWSAPANLIDSEMTRILDMLREKSAVALRLTKASTRLDVSSQPQGRDAEARLEALKQVNEFYLSHVMQTADAGEGLHAFLEKRKPRWKNK